MRSENDDAKHAIKNFLSKAAKEIASAADFVMDPVKHVSEEKQKKQLEKNLAKYEAVMQRQSSGPSVNVLEGHGPVGSDTIVIDRGTAHHAEASQVDGDGHQFYDVAGKPLGIINTRGRIESFVKEMAADGVRLVNSEKFAELGHEVHYLSADVDAGVNIGAVVSVYRPLADEDRYEVINPIVAAVSLLGPQLASLGAAGLAEVGSTPNSASESVRNVGDVVNTVIDQGEGAKKMVGSGSGGLDIGEPIYIIEFSVPGFAPKPENVRSVSASFACKPDRQGRYGVLVKDISAELLGLLDQLG